MTTCQSRLTLLTIFDVPGVHCLFSGLCALISRDFSLYLRFALIAPRKLCKLPFPLAQVPSPLIFHTQIIDTPQRSAQSSLLSREAAKKVGFINIFCIKINSSFSHPTQSQQTNHDRKKPRTMVSRRCRLWENSAEMELFQLVCRC